MNGSNVSVSVDEMIEDGEEDVATAEGQLATALGEPDPLPEPVVAQPARVDGSPGGTTAHDAAAASSWTSTGVSARDALITEAMVTYQGGWTRRKRPRLKELRAHAGISDITRAERNRIWDEMQALGENE